MVLRKGDLMEDILSVGKVPGCRGGTADVSFCACTEWVSHTNRSEYIT